MYIKIKKVISPITLIAFLVTSCMGYAVAYADIGEPAAIYEDDFTQYTTENTVYHEERIGTYANYTWKGLGTRDADWAETPIAENEFGKYYLDSSNEVTVHTNAYIDTTMDGLVVRKFGNDTAHNVVNLDTGDYKPQNIQRFKVNYSNNVLDTTAGGGFRLFVSEDGKSYYTFGASVKSSHSHGGQGGENMTISKNRPFVSKTVNGSTEVILAVGWDKSGITQPLDYEWDITIEGAGNENSLKKISWSMTMKGQKSASDNAEWSGWIIDGDTNIHTLDENGDVISSSPVAVDDATYEVRSARLVNNDFKYPVSLISSGNGGTLFTKVYYEEAQEVQSDNEGDTAVCINLLSGKKINGDASVRFNQVDGGVIESIFWPGHGGEVLSFSADGETFDTDITLDEEGKWINQDSDEVHKAVKLSSADSDINDLLVLGNLSEQNLKIYRGDEIKLYETNSGVIVDGSVFIADSEDIAVLKDNVLTAHNNGVINLEMLSTRTLRIVKAALKVVDGLSEAEESGDKAVIAEYIKNQQAIVDELNSYIADASKEGVKEFFGAEGDVSYIDAVRTTVIEAMLPDELDRFADRILTYAEGFKFDELQDLYDFEEILIRECKLDSVNQAVDEPTFETALDEVGTLFGLSSDNEYYGKCKDTIITELFNARPWSNSGKFTDKLVQTIVLTNITGTISPAWINSMLEYYAGEIGYDTDKYTSISDKEVFARTLLQDKAELTDIESIAKYIDDYEETPASPDETAEVTKTSSRSDRGGGSITVPSGSLTKTPVVTGEDNTVVERKQIYSDVPTDFWAYESIRYLNALNAVNGYEDGSFAPNKSITRAEFAKILLGAFKIEIAEAAEAETEEKAVVFEDITKDDWYYGYMLKANEIGVIKGSGSMCNPDMPITREEMAVMIYRMAISQGKELNDDINVMLFADQNDCESWSYSEVIKLQAAGILEGSDGYFMPKSAATRAESAQMIYKLIFSFEKEVEAVEE